MEGAELAGKILSTWLTLVLCLILLPSVFGVSLGISEVYMKILVKTLEVSAGGMRRPNTFEALGRETPGQWWPRVDLRRAGLMRGDHLGRSAVPRGVRFRLPPALARRQHLGYFRRVEGSGL